MFSYVSEKVSFSKDDLSSCFRFVKGMFYSESHVLNVCRLLQLHPFEGDSAPDSGSKSVDSLALSAHQYPASERCPWFTRTCVNVCFVHSLTVLKQKRASHTFFAETLLVVCVSFQTHRSVCAALTEPSGTLTWGET